MAAIRELYLTSLFLLFSQISGQETNKACESSNFSIVFNFSIGSATFFDRSWYINSTANKIAGVDNTGFLTVEPQYSGRVTLFGSIGITLSGIITSDSGSYLFIIVTAGPITVQTATTTVNVYETPNISCIPIIENNNASSFTCKIPDACPGKNSIQARWDNGSVGVFSCPSTTANTKYKCCAKGDPVTYCYIGNLCTEIECNGTGNGDNHCPDELQKAVGIDLAIIIIGFISWIVVFIVKDDQFRLGLGICSVITIIGCSISIVFLVLKGYQLSLGLGICFGIIILACIICIIILGCVKNGDYLRLGHCICFAIIIVVCISCIVILTKNGVECPEKFLIGLGIGFGILIIVCFISILILVFFKKVIIQNKDTSPRTDEKEVTITAIIYGLWKSVEWIKGKTVLETNGDFTIEPYDNNTRKSSLIIKSSSITNSATYICRAKNRCGCCSAEDSITLPHDKDKPTTGKAEQSEGSEMQMRRRS